jgi:hypothetical protein
MSQRREKLGAGKIESGGVYIVKCLRICYQLRRSFAQLQELVKYRYSKACDG